MRSGSGLIIRLHITEISQLFHVNLLPLSKRICVPVRRVHAVFIQQCTVRKSYCAVESVMDSSPCQVRRGWTPEPIFKENVVYGTGADYNLNLTHSRLRSPAFHPNDDECDECFLNYLKWSNQYEKGSTRKGEGRDGS
jgi:hypothetical protein